MWETTWVKLQWGGGCGTDWDGEERMLGEHHLAGESVDLAGRAH